MIVGSTKENLSLEKRVSITPETAKSIINLGLKVILERDYATHIGIKDEDYKNAGAEMKNSSKPGCLGLDALWQLLGFYLGWLGGKGAGRALYVGGVKFTGQILPNNRKLIYKLDIKRVIMRKLILGIANGKVICDDNLVYEAEDIRVGLFKE